MKVKLTYFHLGGKYYSEGEYETQTPELWLIWEEVLLMRNAGRLPGLIEGHSPFRVLIDVPEHPHNHPHLVM